jgi:FtsP/CotA-like multicopper oxidase with cupredoxin domain
MTDLSRRRVIGLGAVAVGGAAVLGAAQLMGASIAGAAATSQRTLTQWTPLVGKNVSFRTGSGKQVTLTVKAATALRHDRLLTGTGYALLLLGPRNPMLSWSPGVLRNPSGSQPAQLLPVEKPGTRQAYQFIVDVRRPLASARR